VFVIYHPVRHCPGKTDISRKEQTSVIPDHSSSAHLSTTMALAAAPLRKLEPDVISVTQDVVIGMASFFPVLSGRRPAFYREQKISSANTAYYCSSRR
jgi:hypothetical protein